MMTAIQILIAVPWAGALFLACIAIVLSRTLQRAVLTFLHAGMIVLALWALFYAERQASAGWPQVGGTRDSVTR